MATKLPLWKIETLEDVKQMFENQLQRLDVAYVDFYLLHALDKEKWEKAKRLGAVSYTHLAPPCERERDLSAI